MCLQYVLYVCLYLQDEGSQDHTTEYGVTVDGLKNVPLSVDLPGIDLVEQLHHDKHVEHDGVVLRGRRVEGRVAPTVDIKDVLSWERGKSKQDNSYM